MDPYRENLVGRINSLEERVDELTEKSRGQKGAVLWAFRKTVAENLSDFSAGFGIVTIILALIIGAPACFRSCGDTPEEIRARQEVEAERNKQYKSSCEALSLNFVGYDHSRDKLTCGNESSVVVIDLNDGEIESKVIGGGSTTSTSD